MSQLDLGLSADVSSRHISFLETGRSRPSRAMIFRLSEQLELPPAIRNRLLTAAGLAPAHASRSLSDDDMGPAREAVAWMLDRHAPYPAFAIDRHWRIVDMNPSASMLFSGIGIARGDSLLATLVENDGLDATIENLDEVLRYTIVRLRTESAHFGGDAVLGEAIDRMRRKLGTADAGDAALLPAFVPARYRAGDVTLTLFSTIAQFGTAEDIALSELKIELLFPADEPTRQMLLVMAGDAN